MPYPSDARIPASLASTIERLHEQMREQFGLDFAYVILGHDRKIAACNFADGHVLPAPAPFAGASGVPAVTIRLPDLCDEETAERLGMALAHVLRLRPDEYGTFVTAAGEKSPSALARLALSVLADDYDEGPCG